MRDLKRGFKCKNSEQEMKIDENDDHNVEKL